MEEYTREFKKLMMKINIQENEKQTITHYFGRLNTKIAQLVQLQ